MKFENDRLGYAFEGDYPESYGQSDLVRLRLVLQQQIGQLRIGDARADEQLLGVLMGRRCAKSERVQVEPRPRRGGGTCLVARSEVLLAGAAAPVPDGFAALPGAAGAYRRLRRTDTTRSDIDAAIDSCAAAKISAAPNYLSTMAAVSKGVGGPEPAGPPPASPAAEGRPVREPVLVAIIDTGIPPENRRHALLTDVGHTTGDIDQLDVLPAGPDGWLDYQAGHGSFVAGVIRRVAPHAKLRMYRACDSDGFGTDHEIAAAILRAHGDGARIINLSLGVRTVDDQPPPAMEEAVRTVLGASNPPVIVAAAGNFGGTAPVYPAALDDVVAVAGLTAFMAPADWSSSGRHVSFSTVGEGIRSTYVTGVESPVFDPQPDEFGTDPWAIWSGTSFAAPQITGAVARIGYEENMEPRAAVTMLADFGRPIGGFGKAMRILQGIG
jgi:hypothetical protein